MSWQEREAKVYLRTGKRTPLTLVKGQGLRVWDDAGKPYLDFVGGWAVDTLGHCSPVMQKALAEQSKTLIQASNQFYTIPQILLGELLVENSCMDRVYFCNSGAEANEGCVKLARRWAKDKRPGAYEVITALNSFHGRTLAMVSATGQPH
ncbi:MAG: aminotransferase class III-fold pyridoxal phosphate-dependent enzyme, partial [Chloroflexi bacterium]|nr:aminotransferase class III-fold pyridoxal phosphate-dependent enzyme [Chloroflexota bacterium]